MAFSITCDRCSAKLKTATAISVGRSITCPKCQENFKVSRDNMEEVADRPAAARRPVDDEDDRPRSRNRDGDDDDRPSKKRRDDENTLRARKRVDDDEDDRPRSRKRIDEDDDLPTKKRRDDDDDNRPRSRKRDDDDRPTRSRRDDDDDDRPRKKKRKKKKSNTGLMIGLGIGGLVAIAGIVFLCIWLFGGGGYDKEMVSYMPSNSTTITSVDVEAMMDSSFGKIMAESQVNQGRPGQVKDAGFSIGDVKKIVVAMTDKNESVKAVRFKKSADKGKLTSNYQEQKSGDKAYYKPKAGMGEFLYFPSDDLMVTASSEELMKSLISKETGKIVLSDDFKEVLDKVSRGHFWMISKGGGFMGMGKADDIKANGVWMKIGSSSADVGMVKLCSSDDSAKKSQEEAEKEIEKIRKGDGVKSASVSRSGKTVTLEISASTSELEKNGKNNPFMGAFGR